MTAKVLAVCVGQPRAVRTPGSDGREHLVVTGIYKEPVTGAVHVRLWGLENDGQADTRVVKGRQVHGGAEKAVYLYPFEHYAAWRDEWGKKGLPTDIDAGLFGENLTITGLLEDAVRAGDQLRIGEQLLLEVTTPRGPCYKLDMRIGIPEFRHAMEANGRTGFYARVLREGSVRAGDEITLTCSDETRPTVLDLHRS